MKKTLLILSAYCCLNLTYSQEIIKLWDSKPPTDNELTGDEKVDDGRISNVTDPTITIYRPEAKKNKKTAIIICPGGGYWLLAAQHEGAQFAEWLQSEGYTAVVLKYRMPNKHKEVPLEDFQQAIRYVRSKAKEWNFDRVGVSGFSAGGHLAATASTHFKSTETRPDFSVLFYPVISMGEYTHKGSRSNLLGDNPSSTDLYVYSNEKQINANTPPAILFLSDDDKGVVPENSIMYYDALKKNDIPASMYIFPVGGHGWGMHENFRYHKEMKSLLLSWLSALK